MMIRTLESRGVKVVNNAELVKVLSPEEITQRGLNISMQWLESADGKLFPFDEAFWCTQVCQAAIRFIAILQSIEMGEM